MYSSLVRHINRFPNAEWNYTYLSTHPSVHLVTLKTLKDKPWKWNILTTHPNWSWNWVRELPDSDWDWKIISKSPYFNWNWVREFPNKPWDWRGVLSEKVNSINILKEFPDKPWDWYSVTLVHEISTDEMMNNPNFPWTVNKLFFTGIDDNDIRFIRYYRSHYDTDAWCDHTERTSWSIIKKNMDLPWVFYFVQIRNPKEFEESDVKYLYKHTSWNWKHLSEFLDFDNIISKCIDRPWDFEFVSKNKSVTYKHIQTFPGCKWNYNYINLEIDKKEWAAANIIKKFWKRAATDPSFALCRKIVLNDLFGSLESKQSISSNL